MAAGLGFKTFVTGDVLTASDTNGYLMQGVLVFASAAARDAAITSPQEGQFAYLKDTDVTTYYSGSAWTNLDTTGLTNPMTTTGDMIYSSSGSTPARLGIGSTGQVLTVAAGIPSWATASAGGMTLISTTSLTGSTITLSSIPATYNNLQLVIRGFKSTTDNESYNLRFNGVTGSNYVASTSNTGTNTFSDTSIASPGNDNSVNNGLGVHDILDYANTVTWKLCNSVMFGINATTTTSVGINRNFGVFNSTSAISSITIFTGAGTFSGGTALLYGVK